MSSFDSFKTTLLNSASFSQESFNRFGSIADAAFDAVKESTDINTLIKNLLCYSSQVEEGMFPPDCMNSCDGENSVCELFVTGLLDNQEWFSLFLGSEFFISYYQPREAIFILDEMINVMWKYPIKYSSQMLKFVSSYLVGSYFTLCSACYVDDCWYTDALEYNLEELDNLTLNVINTFRQFQPQPLAYKNGDTTFKTWCQHSLEALDFRNVKGLTKTNHYLSFFSLGLFDDLA